MDEKIFALSTVIAGGLFSLLVVVATNLMVGRIEKKKFSWQLTREKVEAIKGLYEDAIFILSNLVVQKGVGTLDQRIEFTRLEARLALFSNNEIQKQFNKTFELAQEMSAYSKSAEPRRIDEKHILVQSEISSHAKEFQRKAEDMLPDYQKHFEELKSLMINHLEKLESNL